MHDHHHISYHHISMIFHICIITLGLTANLLQGEIEIIIFLHCHHHHRHFRAARQNHHHIVRYLSKASLRKSTENVAGGGKELVAARESTYPVF